MPWMNAPDAMVAEQREPLQAIITLLNGGLSEPALMTGISSNTNYAADIKNNGTAGGLRVRTAGTGALRVTPTGVEADGTLAATGAITGASLAVNTSVTAGTTVSAGTSVSAGTTLSSGGLATLNSLAVTNNATVGGTLVGSSTVQGTRLISTIGTGTAPLSVNSTTLVSNLNAEFVGGQNLAGLDGRYVDVAGDTMTGQLTLEPAVASDQRIKLKGLTTSGGFWLGASNAAAPAFILRDNANTLVAQFNPSGSTYGLDVNNGTPSTNSARFTGDVLITTDLGVRTVNATTNLNATANVTANKIVAGGTTFSGTEKLRVISGSSRLEGQLVVTTGGVDVTGSSTFNTATTFASSIDVNGGALITNVTVDGTGTPFTFNGTSQTATTVGAAGAASALPATPSGYLKITVGATDFKIPYYAA